MKLTKIDPEEVQSDYGQFRRKATVFYYKTENLVKCRADIPDTFFSIPATTETEHGFIGIREDGELEFRPHTNQADESPAAYRKYYCSQCK